MEQSTHLINNIWLVVPGPVPVRQSDWQPVSHGSDEARKAEDNDDYLWKKLGNRSNEAKKQRGDAMKR
jgi:hypothetical protein